MLTLDGQEDMSVKSDSSECECLRGMREHDKVRKYREEAMKKYTGWKKRWSYLDDYKKGMNGQYVYYGTYYNFEGSSSEFRRYKMILAMADLLLLALFILGGLMDAGRIWNTWYVVIPFALEAISIFLLLWKTITLIIEKSPIKTYIFKKSVPWFKPLAWITGITAGLSLITTFICMMVNLDYVKVTGCIFYMVIKAIMIACVIIFIKLISKYEFSPDAAEEAKEA